ncbi:PepSY domain-containing protein [Elioraea sp.]|uniref:PepSY domain-containing protein n=1 Tax=Elioraea sp. TaxID=2185103 RepID=UPI003F6EA57D
MPVSVPLPVPLGRLASAAVALWLAPLAALADERCDRGPVRAELAIEIARDVGVALIKELECDDDRWEVEGRDARGHEIKVEIDPRTGRVLKVERD